MKVQLIQEYETFGFDGDGISMHIILVQMEVHVMLFYWMM